MITHTNRVVSSHQGQLWPKRQPSLMDLLVLLAAAAMALVAAVVALMACATLITEQPERPDHYMTCRRSTLVC
jgi:hypothetical protein